MEEKYMFGYPLVKRQSLIQEKVENSRQTETINYHGKLQNIPVIQVPINSLIYRVENIRTKTAQREWLVNHPDLPKDFFETDKGAIEVQQAQHFLLKKIVTKDDLIKAFTVKNGFPIRYQKYKLIISDDGTVVNGNCRLCAWRELFYKDQITYKHFEMIDVAVLPDHDPDGMYQLEVELQLDEPEKEKYAWHAIAADSKEKIDNGISIDQVAKNRDLKPNELIELIDAYDYATEYLKEIGKEDQWSLVDDKFYAFRQIIKSEKKLNGAGQKELFHVISKAFLSQPPEDGRLYDKFPKVAANLPSIVEELKETFNISTDSSSSDDDTDLLLGGDSDETDTENSEIAAALLDKDQKQVVRTVSSVINNLELIEKEKDANQFLFNKVKTAATSLTNAAQNLDDNMSKEGVDKQLETIEDCVNIIRNWLNG